MPSPLYSRMNSSICDLSSWLSFRGMRIALSGAIIAWLNRPVALPLMSKYFCSSKPNSVVVEVDHTRIWPRRTLWVRWSSTRWR